jgi:hypothetical protein
VKDRVLKEILGKDGKGEDSISVKDVAQVQRRVQGPVEGRCEELGASVAELTMSHGIYGKVGTARSDLSSSDGGILQNSAGLIVRCVQLCLVSSPLCDTPVISGSADGLPVVPSNKRMAHECENENWKADEGWT